MNLPDHVKKMTSAQRDRWVSVYNKACGAMKKRKMGDVEAGEAAMRIANRTLQREMTEATDTPSRTYLARLRDFIQNVTKSGETLTDEKLTEIHKMARNSAGGMASAAKRREATAASELADFCASSVCTCGEADCGDHDDGEGHLFTAISFAEPPVRINVLPKPGSYSHPSYGTITITQARNANFVKNFKAGVYQEKIPIDLEHQTKLSGAAGWMTDLEQNGDGSVDAYVEWTDRGQEAIKENRFKYFSPEWYAKWQDPISDKIYEDVLIGGALCTKPFFKEKALMPLVATESGLSVLDEILEDEDETEIVIFTEMTAETFSDGPNTISTNIGAYLESSIHSNFTSIADQLRKYNYVTQDERIALSGAIGAALKAFCADADINILARSLEIPKPYLYNEDGSKTPIEVIAKEYTPATGEQPKGGNTVTNEELEALVNELKTQVTALTEANTAAKTASEQADEQRNKAEERVKTLEAESRSRRFTDIVLGRTGTSEGVRWYGEADKHVNMMEQLATAFGEDSDPFKSYIDMQVGNAKRMKESGIFTEVGVEEGAASTSGDQIKDAVKAKRAENVKMTEAEAYTEVITEHPEWYAEDRKTQDKRIAHSTDE